MATGRKDDPLDITLYTINHAFLPPQLPQSDDYDPARDDALLGLAIEGLLEFRAAFPESDHAYVDEVVTMLRNTRQVHASGCVNGEALEKLLAQLLQPGSSVALHIKSQNAGVSIRSTGSGVQFDVFELSPLNEAVQTTKGRLRRNFPGASVKLDAATLRQDGLVTTVASILESLSGQSVVGMQPKARKAGCDDDEARDTTHPAMVCEAFVGFLASVGETAATPAISKNTREEVLWDSTKLPWRRSPMWLLLRVEMHLACMARFGSDTSYKKVMISIMCKILTRSVDRGVRSDLIYCMIAKLARRLCKLDIAEDSKFVQEVRGRMADATNMLAQRWSAVQQKDARNLHLGRLASLDFSDDSSLMLSSLDDFIHRITHRAKGKTTGQITLPIVSQAFRSDELPQLSSYDHMRPNSTLKLLAFEDWVAQHLQTWIKMHQGDSNTCRKLCFVIENYQALGQQVYLDNPEGLSNMILTVLELWVACDKAACLAHSLLSQYNPGISTRMLENLLLPSINQMKRLHLVEQYIARRIGAARFPATMLYVKLKHPDCFAAKYFNASPSHQATLQAITAAGQRAREEKVAEWERLKTMFDDLMQKHNSTACEFTRVRVDSYNDFWENKHSNRCTKCYYRQQAQALEIDVHEWPITTHNVVAKVVVFELDIPKTFQAWRRATLNMIKGTLRATSTSPQGGEHRYMLQNDPHLQAYATAPSDSVSLSSKTKAQVITHRSAKSIASSTMNDVCRKNGLQYQYYDCEDLAFICDFEWNDDVANMCTYRLPARSAALQAFIHRPHQSPDGPPPNAVIAQQADTPDNMSIEEYRDLTVIPLGHQLHWLNISLQLEAPSVDFRKKETALVILQCIYQTGPTSEHGKERRAAHELISENAYGIVCTNSLMVAFKRIKRNWESVQILNVLTAIACRLLSLTASPAVRENCLFFLTECSKAAFAWTEELRQKSEAAIMDDDRTEFNNRRTEIALACALATDIDEQYLHRLLDTHGMASRLLTCHIIIHEGIEKLSSEKDSLMNLCILRYRRLSLRASSILTALPNSLDEAIATYWPAYRPNSNGWNAVSGQEYWMGTTTEVTQGGNLSVHFNTLDGSLLVDGLPLGRPPKLYESLPMWKLIFGHSPVEVLPTTVPGMDFSAKRRWNDYDIHFGQDPLSQGLVVRATRLGTTYETLPASLFEGQFPDSFVTDFVHWFDHRHNTVQFRPIDDLWNCSSAKNWTLSKVNSKWKLSRNDTHLVGLKSRTAQTISEIFSPLSLPGQIHIVLPRGAPAQIELASIDLTFLIYPGRTSLRSREYRGYNVAEEQSAGALVGFENKFVLEQSDGAKRCILLPESKAFTSRTVSHVSVTMNRRSIRKVHRVDVNQQLGRLESSGSLRGKLYLAYMHAVTAHCLPDPLTGHPGTESALEILNSAAVRSFDQLTQEDIAILEEISRLSPNREFYPSNERVMQKVSWQSQLSFLAQDGAFRTAVQSLFDQSNEMRLFHPQTADLRLSDGTDAHLQARDKIRSTTFRQSGGGEKQGVPGGSDCQYASRDANQSSQLCKNVHAFSTLIYTGARHRLFDGLSPDRLWSVIVKENPALVRGAQANFSPDSFRNFVSTVNNPRTFDLWPAMHSYLSKPGAAKSQKFVLMGWISAMAANSTWRGDIELLQILALSASCQLLKDIHAPEIETCSPSKGFTASKQLIRQVVHSQCVPLAQTPEALLKKNDGEDRERFQNRQQARLRANQDEAIEHLVDGYYTQWLLEKPKKPKKVNIDSKTSAYIYSNAAYEKVVLLFDIWYANQQYFDYFYRLSTMVTSLPMHFIPNPEWYKNTISRPHRRTAYVTVSQLFTQNAPACSTPPPQLDFHDDSIQQAVMDSPRTANLIECLRGLCQGSQFERRYIEELNGSLMSLQGQHRRNSFESITSDIKAELTAFLERCSDHVTHIYQDIVSALRSEDQASPCSSNFYAPSDTIFQRPCLSPTLVLAQLTQKWWHQLSLDWKTAIVKYGLALVAYRRAIRLLDAANAESCEDFLKEIENVGHEDWDPLEFPEWLLLEIEAGITIRKVQAQIAVHMMDPPGRDNAVMQLNMGEGKSSVIVPMVAAHLANAAQLCRVIVAKPQSKQMAHMLIAKLGGLVGRRIRYLPFSRALKLSPSQAQDIKKMLEDCKRDGDVLLVQPEFLLSFQLMGLETYIANNDALGKVLVEAYDFMRNNARSVVDESDENFSVKFELVYTMGTQRAIELSPYRWGYIQHVFEIVQLQLPGVRRTHPDGIEAIDVGAGAFPRFRILTEDAEKSMLDAVGKHIYTFGFDGFPIARQPAQVRDAVFTYITQRSFSQAKLKDIEDNMQAFMTDSTRAVILLLRGLLAQGILGFVLRQKRWRVNNYGLDSTRTPATLLAVPYQAKDGPTARSEFSHPDVVICLTSLSYYFGGLTDEENTVMQLNINRR